MELLYKKIIFDELEKLEITLSESKIGNPYVDNAKVTAKLVSNGKHDKIRVFKMKRRQNYRRTYGHRQKFSEIHIESISS